MSYLIVGLGNIGAEYADTRHNAGFYVLDALARASNISFISSRYGSIAEYKFKGKRFVLLKPSTYMNLSGKAVNYWLKAENIEQENMLVVVDDIAIPFGELRMRKQGSDGGHNGLKDIISVLGNNNFSRIRVGIGGDFSRGQQVDYVLGTWSSEERLALPAIAEKAIETIKMFGTVGVDRTMNYCNTK
ncbi:Peptidyl-tRNA hydrolase [Bacteroidales bacterium CF]|jgi:PTH1 family peptidyl-tRNA hydrolase|nr:Peptidyl-tRNA hydrolase [Bacteroidales bacterium CF]